jgi:hypothetical protein
MPAWSDRKRIKVFAIVLPVLKLDPLEPRLQKLVWFSNRECMVEARSKNLKTSHLRCRPRSVRHADSVQQD